MLIVHGIGSKEQWQDINLKAFNKSMKQVSKMYYKNSRYEFVVRMVDWKSMLENEKPTKEKINRVTIKEGADSFREVFNETSVDILFYLSNKYRSLILSRVTT